MLRKKTLCVLLGYRLQHFNRPSKRTQMYSLLIMNMILILPFNLYSTVRLRIIFFYNAIRHGVGEFGRHGFLASVESIRNKHSVSTLSNRLFAGVDFGHLDRLLYYVCSQDCVGRRDTTETKLGERCAHQLHGLPEAKRRAKFTS
jgi:hypothetical protein